MPVLHRVQPGGPGNRSANETIADAREALAYWRRREARLGWHQRAARAEAREHVARWHEHVERAQLERWGLEASHPLAPLVGALGLPRQEQLRRLGGLLRTTRIARLVRRLVVAAAVVTLATFALVVVLVSRLV